MNKANKKSILKGGMWGSKPRSGDNDPFAYDPTKPKSKPTKPKSKPSKPKSEPNKPVKPKSNSKNTKKQIQIAGWGEQKKNKTKKSKKSKKVNTLVGAGWGGVPPPNRYLVGGGWGGRTRPIMIDATKLRQEKGSRFINKYFKKYF